MKKEVLEVEVKTGQSEANIKDVADAIKDLNKNIVSGNKKTEESLKGVEQQGQKTRNILGGISKLFKGALGIGIVVQAFQLLKDTFVSNQRVADVFSNVMETVSIVFNQVVDAVVKGNGEFNALGKVLSGLVTIGLTPIKLGFNGIKLGLQQAQLVWENSFFGGKDQDKIKKLRADIIETKNEIYNVADGAINAGKDVYDNFSNAISSITDISIKAAYEQAQVNTQLQKNAKLATVANQGLIEQYDREAEILRQLRDDTSRSITDRIKANEDLGVVLENQQKAMLANAALITAAANAQFKKNKNDENAVALQEALNEQAAIEAQITGFKSEQQTNLNSLLQEQKDLKNELALIGKNEVETVKIEAQQKLDAQMELIYREVENETERNRLLLEAKRVYDEEIIAIDAEVTAKELDAAKEKAAKEKEIKDKSLAESKAIAEAEAAIRDGNLDNISAGFNLLGQLAGKNRKLQSLALIGDSAVGIAKIIINTQAANARGLAELGPILGAANAIKNNISAGIGIASTTVATAKGLNALKAGGSAPSASIGSRGDGGSFRQAQAPTFNVVGQSGTNQLAQSIGGQEKQPIKAYVVAADVTTAQSMQRNIIESASI